MSQEPRTKSQIMETIAVYWEENIRTYGLQLEKNLCVVQVDILPSKLDVLGQLIAELGKGEIKTRLILAHHFEPECLTFSIVFPEKYEKHLLERLAQPSAQNIFNAFSLDAPMEMLYFHGPHFGDRYGIADMAATALQKKNIRYKMMGCSAASVHFLFPENIGERAKKALEPVFNIP